MSAIPDFLTYQSDYNNYLRETYDLLTLVNQSYQALGIGPLHSILDLQTAIADTETVRRRVMEQHCPADAESLGLAASFTSTEEMDTFVRMVSFFHKKKSAKGIPWQLFTVQQGELLFKEEEMPLHTER